MFPDRNAKMFPSRIVKEFQKRNANKFPERNASRSQESPARPFPSRSAGMSRDKYVTRCPSKNARTFPARSVRMCHDKAAKMFQSKTAQLFTSVQFVRSQAISQHQRIRDRFSVSDLNHSLVECTPSPSHNITQSNRNGISGICHTAIQVLFIIFIFYPIVSFKRK